MLLYGALSGTLVRTARPDTPLPSAVHDGLPARHRDELAAARDAFPLSRSLQELPCSAAGRVQRVLADDEGAVRVHELTITAPLPLGAGDAQDVGPVRYVELSKAFFSGLLRAMPLMSTLRTVRSWLAEMVVTVDAPQFTRSYDSAAAATAAGEATPATRATK